MAVAGILLTGGASTRMGSDKALLRPAGDDETLARRSARLLAEVADPCVEVGPGCSGLPAVEESPRRSGPLAAVARGWEVVAAARRPVLVVATDLPALDSATLWWLARYRARTSVVPLVAGRPQPLCARWCGADLDLAVILVAAGSRALRDLLGATKPTLVDPAGPGGPGEAAFGDADTPAQASLHGLRLP